MPSDQAETGLLPGTRALLIVFSALTLLAVVVLFGRPDQTGRFFAWTIAPPLTAAFLGAGYGAGCVLVALSWRAGQWPAVRIPLLTIAVFTLVTLAATLLHLDRFHLRGAASIATFAGWFWLVIYIVIPPSMLVLWLIQERHAGRPPEVNRMPRWLAGLLLVQGAVLLVAGVVLFAVPSTADTWWPWALTPLTARAVAAWLIAFGLATCVAAAREGLVRSRIQAISYSVFGVLQLLALLRFTGEPDWASPQPWVYLALLMVITVTGLLGIGLGRAAARTAGGPRVPVT